jgi:threonylcarbamoyladenosine tRNA methylthiotransferase MtaB
MLAILSEKKRRHFYEQYLGQTRPVLFEHSKTPGRVSGFTDNYIKIEAELEEVWINHVAPLSLQSLSPDGLVLGQLA